MIVWLHRLYLSLNVRYFVMINRNHGFTLIEIIIVISIMALLLGVGTVSYNSFGRQKSLEQDAEMVRDRLSIIRERAVSREISKNTNCDPFNGYRLRLQPSGNFTLFLRCGQPPTIPLTETNTNENFTLNSSVIAFPTVNTDYMFLYPYGCDTTGCTTNRAANRIRIRNQNNTQCVDITIDNLGKTTLSQPFSGPC